MNQELIACLKELLARVESCPFDLGSMDDIKVDLMLHSVGSNSQAVAEYLSDAGTVRHNGTDDDKLSWHHGYINRRAEIVAFITSTDAAVVEPQPLEPAL